MSYTKEQQIGTKKVKKSRQTPGMTPERLKLEAEKRAAYERIANEREPLCEGCGSPNFEHSHRFPVSYQNYAYIAVDEAIDLYCRHCHTYRYENGRIYELKNGEEVMAYLQRTDFQFFMSKLSQMEQRMTEALTDPKRIGKPMFPKWAVGLVVKYLYDGNK